MVEESQKDASPMDTDKRRDFTGKLVAKLSFVRSVAALGKKVDAAEQAVVGQIHDTITTGNPKKA